MGDPGITKEYLKLKPDRIVDARGIVFSEKLTIIADSINSFSTGDIILIYCSDLLHIKKIPDWLEQNGHQLINTIEEQNYFKMIIKIGAKSIISPNSIS